jgi:hypothetical protein
MKTKESTANKRETTGNGRLAMSKVEDESELTTQSNKNKKKNVENFSTQQQRKKKTYEKLF